MRLIANIDWADFFESVSIVDQALSAAPTYRRMDFRTRDRYRRAIEMLARRARLDEIEIATRAVREARRCRTPGKPQSRDRCGILPDRPWSRKTSKSASGLLRPSGTASRVPWREQVWLVICLATALVSAALVALVLAVERRTRRNAATLIGLAMLALLPASDLALALINRFATSREGTRDASRHGAQRRRAGRPAHNPGCADPADPDRSNRGHIRRIEVHYLSNADARLQFILLSDWTDSDTEHAPDDAALLSVPQAGITALNERYSNAVPTSFPFAPSQAAVECGAGQMDGLGAQARQAARTEPPSAGQPETSFLDGDAAIAALPAKVRYVITLDADTRLPRGAAHRLIGKMAHPLNAPADRPRTRCVIAGAWHPAAARDAEPADRLGKFAVPMGVFRP